MKSKCTLRRQRERPGKAQRAELARMGQEDKDAAVTPTTEAATGARQPDAAGSSGAAGSATADMASLDLPSSGGSQENPQPEADTGATQAPRRSGLPELVGLPLTQVAPVPQVIDPDASPFRAQALEHKEGAILAWPRRPPTPPPARGRRPRPPVHMDTSGDSMTDTGAAASSAGGPEPPARDGPPYPPESTTSASLAEAMRRRGGRVIKNYINGAQVKTAINCQLTTLVPPAALYVSAGTASQVGGLCGHSWWTGLGDPRPGHCHVLRLALSSEGRIPCMPASPSRAWLPRYGMYPVRGTSRWRTSSVGTAADVSGRQHLHRHCWARVGRVRGLVGFGGPRIFLGRWTFVRPGALNGTRVTRQIKRREPSGVIACYHDAVARAPAPSEPCHVSERSTNAHTVAGEPSGLGLPRPAVCRVLGSVSIRHIIPARDSWTRAEVNRLAGPGLSRPDDRQALGFSSETGPADYMFLQLAPRRLLRLGAVSSTHSRRECGMQSLSPYRDTARYVFASVCQN